MNFKNFFSIFFSIFCLTHIANAKLSNIAKQLQKAHCVKKIEQKMGAKLKKQAWMPENINDFDLTLVQGLTFRDSGADKFYRLWSHGNLDQFVEYDLKNEKQFVTSWDSSKACEQKNLELPYKMPDLQYAKTGFTDADLKKLLADHPVGIIYVWSPYMPLSFESLRNLKKVAKKKGAHLTVLLDPKADLMDAKKWVEKNEVSKEELTFVASKELMARQLAVHFPVAFFYKNKFISNRVYVGHKEVSIYEKWYDTQMARMAKERE